MLTDWLGWRSVFFANLPLIALVFVLSTYSIAPDVRAPIALRSFDLPGAITVTSASVSLVLALVQGATFGWLSPLPVAAFILAAALYATFLLAESRTEFPLVPRSALRVRNLRLGTGIAFAFMATLGSLPYFLTLILQNVYGYSPFRAGLAFIVPCACVLVGTMAGARLTSRIGLRTTLFTSMIGAGVGIALFALSLTSAGGIAPLLPGVIVMSFAQGVIFTAMYAAATSDVPEDFQGLASGVASTGQQLGGAVGLAVLVAASSAGGNGKATEIAIVDGARTASIVAAVAITLAATLSIGVRTATPTSKTPST